MQRTLWLMGLLLGGLLVAGLAGLGGSAGAARPAASAGAGPLGGATATPTCTSLGAPGPWVVVSPAPADFFGGAATSDGTSAYVAGGYSFSSGGVLGQFIRYNPATNTWVALAAMPQAAASASAVYAPNANKIFVFGGEDLNSQTVFNITRVYDLASNTWSTGANMPGARQQMASGYYNGKIYLAGGYSTDQVSGAQAQLWEFDPAAGTFNTARQNMPQALGGAGYGIVNGHLYVIGGRDAVTPARNQVYDYNIAANTWTSRANLPVADNAPGSAVIGGHIWVFGGGQPFDVRRGATAPAAAPATTNTTQIYDPATDTWSTGPTLNVARSFPAGTAAGAYAVAVGGYTGSTSTNSTETSFNPPVPCGSVTATPVLPSATATFTAVPTNTASRTPTVAPTSTRTATPVATNTPTASSTRTVTPLPSSTPTTGPSVTGTVTPLATATRTPTPLTTSTPVPPTTTPTSGPSGTPPPTGVPTSTRSATPAPSSTPVLASATPVPSSTAAVASATPVPPSATGVPATGTAPAATRTPAPSVTACAISFSDVQPTDYFYTPVVYLYCHGVISGYSDGTFRPYADTTRAQMVKIVVLGFGKSITTPAGGAYTFSDVPPAQPFFPYIETAAALNIVSGYDCGGPGEPCDAQNRPYFRPNASVTRGQLSKIDVVAAGWPLQNPPAGTFADVVPNSAFYTFVETAACHGIISGYNCGGSGEPCDAQNRPYFRQFYNATRGQIAKIVYLSVTGAGACAPPDGR